MNGNKNNNAHRDWRRIYAQWDRERLEEELVRQAEQIRALKDERNQLQSRIRQLEHSRQGDAPPAYDVQEGGMEGAAAEMPESDSKSEPVRQSSGRFQVEVVPAEALRLDPTPISSDSLSEEVEIARGETRRRAARREESNGMWG